MSWNYRVCKETINEFTSYSIREAYYNDDNGIWAVSKDPMSAYSEIMDNDLTEEGALKELKSDLDKMLLALDKDIIDLTDFVFAEHES